MSTMNWYIPKILTFINWMRRTPTGWLRGLVLAPRQQAAAGSFTSLPPSGSVQATAPPLAATNHVSAPSVWRYHCEGPSAAPTSGFSFSSAPSGAAPSGALVAPFGALVSFSEAFFTQKPATKPEHFAMRPNRPPIMPRI